MVFVKENLLAIPVGLEPTTYGLEGHCSIQLSYGIIMAGAAGLEPATSVLETNIFPVKLDTYKRMAVWTGVEPA